MKCGREKISNDIQTGIDDIEIEKDLTETKKSKNNRIISVICIILIAGALLFLLYYHVIQPYLSEVSTDKYRDLYHSGTEEPSAEENSTEDSEEKESTEESIEQETSALSENQSKRFEALVKYNPDIRGWLIVPGTNIDYPVVQANGLEGEEYYLTHNVDGDTDKNGSLFIDYRTVISEDSRVIVINGHNMKSTGLMFHELIKFKTLDFYKENPVMTFDTVYGDSQWKIISLIRTNNNESQGERFNFFRSDFESDADFMDFVYETKLRSMFNCPVNVNEDDTLLFLSTCTSEMNDMRFVIVARKVREGEEADVDVSQACERDDVLYPDAWYGVFGGNKPELMSFNDAYAAGKIDWYDGKLFE